MEVNVERKLLELDEYLLRFSDEKCVFIRTATVEDIPQLVNHANDFRFGILIRSKYANHFDIICDFHHFIQVRYGSMGTTSKYHNKILLRM